jgi:multidrug efflux system outer membrane protein
MRPDIRHIFVSGIALVLLSGCTLIPGLSDPPSPVPPLYPTGEGYDPALMNEATAPKLSDIAWPNFFQNETVKTLIRVGLEKNRDLKTAALAIAEARARYGIERSDLVPDIDGGGSFTRERRPRPQGGVSAGDPITETYSATLGVTAYEIDLFGRLRSLSQAALNDYFATEAARESVRISLIADIASTYVDFRADQALLAIATETVQAQRDTFDLIQLQTEEGVASNLDLRQAETLLHEARVDRFQYINAVSQDLNALRLLLGSPREMGYLDEPFSADRFFNTFVIDIPAGLPATLLTSRPDIIQAEYELRAANANIGAARAAFFPSVSLTTIGGYMAGEFSNLFEAGTKFWRFAPQVNIPIFTGGRLKNSLDLAEIRKNMAVLDYERAIETAFREVADALSAVSTLDDRVRAQADLVEATKAASRLSQMRYDAGVENYLSVLDARRALYAARQGVIRQKADEIKAKIALYRAVGGGWTEDRSSPIKSAATEG